jgi:hypothetical protein
MTISGMSRFVDGGDLWMPEARQSLRLAMEQARVHFIDRVPAAHYLERHPPLRRALLSLVDNPHPTLTEYAEDAVSADRLDCFYRQYR